MSKKITFSLEISDEDYDVLEYMNNRNNKSRRLHSTISHSGDKSIEDYLGSRLFNCRKGLVNTFQISNYTAVIE